MGSRLQLGLKGHIAVFCLATLRGRDTFTHSTKILFTAVRFHPVFPQIDSWLVQIQRRMSPFYILGLNGLMMTYRTKWLDFFDQVVFEGNVCYCSEHLIKLIVNLTIIHIFYGPALNAKRGAWAYSNTSVRSACLTVRST